MALTDATSRFYNCYIPRAKWRSMAHGVRNYGNLDIFKNHLAALGLAKIRPQMPLTIRVRALSCQVPSNCCKT